MDLREWVPNRARHFRCRIRKALIVNTTEANATPSESTNEAPPSESASAAPVAAEGEAEAARVVEASAVTPVAENAAPTKAAAPWDIESYYGFPCTRKATPATPATASTGENDDSL